MLIKQRPQTWQLYPQCRPATAPRRLPLLLWRLGTICSGPCGGL